MLLPTIDPHPLNVGANARVVFVIFSKIALPPAVSYDELHVPVQELSVMSAWAAILEME